MVSQGDLIAGRYELTAHLGDGGSASVWRARDRTLHRAVALKLLYAQDERTAEQHAEQFLREAQLASAVDHPNVVRTLDVGRAQDGRPYMVMELLEGEELAERIEREPLAIEAAVALVADVLRGLSAVHAVNIVHRDLKPENIFLARSGTGVAPKILDFGIARSVEKPRSEGRRSVLTTQEGLIVGTPEYMSPEQARGVVDIDHRSDLWSVGVLLFELLTGRLPFEAELQGDLLVLIATTRPPRACDVRANVGDSLSDFIERALSRDPAERFASATEMLTALLEAECGRHDEVTARITPLSQRALPTPWRGRATLLSAGSMAGLIVATAWVVAHDRTLRTDAAGAPTVAEGPLLAGAGGEGALEKALHVRLREVPEGALVTVNGRQVFATDLTFADDGHARLIEVSAPGREPWRVLHPAGNHADYVVKLLPGPSPTRVP